MALNRSDKEWIKSAVREIVAEVVSPIDTKANKLDMTIFGPDGKNGIYAETKTLTKDMGQVKLRMAWIAGGISVGLFAVKEIAMKLLTGKS